MLLAKFQKRIFLTNDMGLNYQTSESVKSLLSFIKWDHTKRDNWFTGEGNNTGFLPQNTFYSTWGDKKFNLVKKNYKDRISKGKVKIFYLDLIEHTIKELKIEVLQDSNSISLIDVFSSTADINQINTYLRLVAYYSALIELEINYRTN